MITSSCTPPGAEYAGCLPGGYAPFYDAVPADGWTTDPPTAHERDAAVLEAFLAAERLWHLAHLRVSPLSRLALAARLGPVWTVRPSELARRATVMPHTRPCTPRSGSVAPTVPDSLGPRRPMAQRGAQGLSPRDHRPTTTTRQTGQPS